MLTYHEIMGITVIMSCVGMSNFVLSPLYRRLRINPIIIRMLVLVTLIVLEA